MKKEEEAIKKLIDNLNERMKELNCIYKVEELLNNFDIDAETAIEKIIEIIPFGWQSPQDCSIKILYDNKEYFSSPFEESDYFQSAYLIHEKNVIGKINVYYKKNISRDEENVFLNEEQKLLNTIAERLGNFLFYKKISENSNKNEKLKFQKTKETTSHYDWLKNNFHLSDAEILQMFQVKLKFKKGETLCKQGSFTSNIIFFAEGLSKVYLETSNEKNIIIKLIKSFDFIGLSSLFGENHFHISASTLTPCTIYLIDKEQFKKIIFSNQNFCSDIFNWYCKHYGYLFNKIESIGNKQATGRIADALLYLGFDVFQDGVIDASISRKDIAEISGMSVENAVRILTDFKNDNIITTEKSIIKIKNENILKTLSLM